jgi:hypothetical protein
MGSPRLRLVGLMALLLTASAMLSFEPGTHAQPPAKAGPDPQALANIIDRFITAAQQTAQAKPTHPADDAEFLRRVNIDIAGRIPHVSDLRTFLDDPSPEKRPQEVERLLREPANAYVNNFINVYRSLLLPETDASFEARFLVPAFENWLRKKLTENTPYDKMVREIMTVAFSGDRRQLVDPTGQSSEASPGGFYIAKEAKPENLAASTARTFLGIRLECAQCHNHPTAKWKQEQFWSYAAFFAGLQRQGGDNVLNANIREVLDRRELAIPNTETVVQAAFLDGKEPEWKYKVGPRVTLADWITARDNPYFAKAAVNRMWAHFFGIGLVDPVDDLDAENPPSHPELLDEMARQFIEANYDQKFLIRAITSSKAYQLSSVQTHKSQEDPRLFARMAVKGMTPEQIFDSVAMAIGYSETQPRNLRAGILDANSPRDQFLARFSGSVDKKTESQTSILQALSLMNGKFIADATSTEGSATLAGVIDAPFMDTNERIETLFLATLSRKPKPAELQRLAKYVDRGGAAGDSKKALADVFWALLNSGEFILNH